MQREDGNVVKNTLNISKSVPHISRIFILLSQNPLNIYILPSLLIYIYSEAHMCNASIRTPFCSENGAYALHKPKLAAPAHSRIQTHSFSYICC